MGLLLLGLCEADVAVLPYNHMFETLPLVHNPAVYAACPFTHTPWSQSSVD